MERKKLDRLSELTAIARSRELTAEETRERTALRNEYRAAVTGSLRAHLDSLTIVDSDGNAIRSGKRSFNADTETDSDGGETSGGLNR